MCLQIFIHAFQLPPLSMIGGGGWGAGPKTLTFPLPSPGPWPLSTALKFYIQSIEIAIPTSQGDPDSSFPLWAVENNVCSIGLLVRAINNQVLEAHLQATSQKDRPR